MLENLIKTRLREMNKKYNMFNLFRNDRKAYASEHKIQEFKEILLEKKQIHPEIINVLRPNDLMTK